MRLYYLSFTQEDIRIRCSNILYIEEDTTPVSEDGYCILYILIFQTYLIKWNILAILASPIFTLRKKGSKVVLSEEPSKVQQRTEKGSLKNQKGLQT